MGDPTGAYRDAIREIDLEQQQLVSLRHVPEPKPGPPHG